MRNKYILLVKSTGSSTDRLLQQIHLQGGEVIYIPCVAIQPFQLEDIQSCLLHAQSADIFLWMSPNAVFWTRSLVKTFDTIWLTRQLVTIGSSTADALKAWLGKEAPILVAGGSSERVLDLPLFQPEHIYNKKVGIFRGVRGRDLIAQSLQEKGCTDVIHIDLYQRILPATAQKALEGALENKSVDIVIFSSVTEIDHLVRIASASLMQQLEVCTVVVPSQRIAIHANQSGFTGSKVITETMSTDAILQALAGL